jgi:peptidyl-prolyl cis-trans isomerase SurA
MSLQCLHIKKTEFKHHSQTFSSVHNRFGTVKAVFLRLFETFINSEFYTSLSMKYLFSFLISFLFCTTLLQAQGNDPVLFSVGPTSVKASEFVYIYSKTNQNKADFSEASLREYLDLYTKFKMKVQKARDMKFDTIPSLKTELDGYRRQVANSYLIDKEVTDRLVREAYDRMDRDLELSHIVINCKSTASAADTLIAYNKAMEAYQKIKSGMNFEAAVTQYSDDPSKAENKGNIGWVTAMLPAGFYNMEVAVYQAKLGDILLPVRSDIGYHVVKVLQQRPARGEMDIAHIMTRTDEKNPDAAKQKIDEIYAKLLTGGNWDEICKELSEDKQTAPKGGSLGFFGINRYQRSFEDAAFGIKTDGAFSQPVKTQVGWHIIKRISTKMVGKYEAEKRRITDLVKRDTRSEVARQNMISNIKKQSGFIEYRSNLAKWAAMQTDTFLTFRWKPSEIQDKTLLCIYGKQPASISDFEDFCNRTSRERMSGSGSVPVTEMIDRLYTMFTDDLAMRYEETQLDAKYPDFKSLMREYEEGNLLFFAAKELVWDKANVDSVGLKAFFDQNLKTKYNWEERKSVSYYTIQSADPKVIAKVQKLAKTKNAQAVVKKMNKKTEIVKVGEKTFEKSKINDPNIEKNGVGYLSTPVVEEGKTASFYKIEKTMPAGPKALNECKGYAVADYQDYLEKEWINSLKQEYPLKVDEAAFKALIK